MGDIRNLRTDAAAGLIHNEDMNDALCPRALLLPRALNCFLLIAISSSTINSTAQAQHSPRPDDDPRVTPTVKLVRRCLPAAVSIRVVRPTGQSNVIQFGHGGGSVIHPDGYILTNNHVVTAAPRVEAAFFQGEWKPVHVIARLPAEDLALLKFDSDAPLPALPLGRSGDLELGEPVITIGSAGALPHSLSAGLISGLGRATNTEYAFLPSMVQTSAPVSGGSSGGPLINALGQQIGVVTSRKEGGENLGFAITIDRVREVFPQLIAAEERFGIRHGVGVEMLADGPAPVTSVAEDSPASKAGLQAGDAIAAIDGRPLHSGVDFHLALIGRKPGGRMRLDVIRGQRKLELSLELAAAKQLEPVQIDGLQPGLRVARYEGQWQRLPDFDMLEPVESGITKASPRTLDDMERDHYGQRYSGFLKIPADGVYFFSTTSDDGSRLWVGERLLVDNDGAHAAQTVSGMARLRPGIYPLRVDFFEAGGEQTLRVRVETPAGKRSELPADWLFHAP